MSSRDLDALYDVDAHAVERFAAEGFVKLRNVLDPETIARYEPEITDRLIELNMMHLPMAERTTYQKSFLQVGNLWRHSEAVREFTFSRRLASIAAQLLGVSAVRLYHDQALYKEAGGGVTPWHADQYYWPFSSDRVCTVWVPLQETPLEMGPLSFSQGSHRFELGRDLPISDESESAMQRALQQQELPLSQEAYELGEVSYHLGWTFHRAETNTTTSPRRVMTMIYMDADITVAEPTNSEQENDRRKWLCDTPVGIIPETELNPVLFRAE
ncbi:phytanoyl-CoA dioxygenase family protein [Streptomyces sp. SYSU K217416]